MNLKELLYGEFELGGYHFAAYLPDNENCDWTIVVTKDGEEQRRETVQMMHEPLFGPDVEDVATLDERIEAIIHEMGLE